MQLRPAERKTGALRPVKSKPATIREVARRAKVSVASVSRALNGSEKLREETRERVMQAIKDLHYVPNAAARSLSMSRTQTIGVVLPDLFGEFFSELIRGMDNAASGHGYLLLLSTMHSDPALAGQAIAAMRGRVDGVIVMAPQLSRVILDSLFPSELPGVELISEAGASRPSVGIDNRAGAELAARHLIRLGRRRLAHIMGPPGNFDAKQRRDGFLAAVREAGLAPPLLGAGDFGEESGARTVDDWIARGEPLDGLMAANDMMAIGAMDALRRHGRRVPEDVAVIGFDDIPLARHLGLSTIEVHAAEMGMAAVNRLVANIENRHSDTEHYLQPIELILRSSTEGR